MDPISSLNPVLDALRRQLAENLERLRKSGKLTDSARPGASHRAGSSAPSLEATLARRLAAIDRRSPERQSLAMRALVETVLAAEFGEALAADAGFGDLAAQISASMCEDPTMRDRMDQLLEER